MNPYRENAVPQKPARTHTNQRPRRIVAKSQTDWFAIFLICSVCIVMLGSIGDMMYHDAENNGFRKGEQYHACLDQPNHDFDKCWNAYH